MNAAQLHALAVLEHDAPDDLDAFCHAHDAIQRVDDALSALAGYVASPSVQDARALLLRARLLLADAAEVVLTADDRGDA